MHTCEARGPFNGPLASHDTFCLRQAYEQLVNTQVIVEFRVERHADLVAGAHSHDAVVNAREHLGARSAQSRLE